MVSATTGVFLDHCSRLAEKRSDGGPTDACLASAVSAASLQMHDADSTELFTSSFAQAKPLRGALPAWRADASMNCNNEERGWELLTIRHGTTHDQNATLAGKSKRRVKHQPQSQWWGPQRWQV